MTLALRGRGTGGARVVPALKVSHTVLDFGLVWVNASPTTQRTILLRNSGDTEIHFEGIAQTGPFDLGNDCGASLGPHFWCRIFVTMHPNGGAPLNGQITIISDAPNAPGTVTVTGQGTAAPASTLQWTQAPSSPLEFGNAYVGGATTRSLVMVNTGPMLVHISGVSITSGSDVQDFSAAGGSCLSGPLAPGAFCDVTVDFAPQSAGVKLAAIRIAADAAPPADMVLAGTGIGPPPLALVPSSMNFGDVTVGQKSQPMTIELRNNGSTLLHIGGIEANGPFQQLAGNCPPPPITVGPHSSACQLRLVYSPLGTGMATGTLVVRSDSPETSALVPLTGSGIAPPKATRERRSARRDPTGPIQNTTRAGPAL